MGRDSGGREGEKVGDCGKVRLWWRGKGEGGDNGGREGEKVGEGRKGVRG